MWTIEEARGAQVFHQACAKCHEEGPPAYKGPTAQRLKAAFPHGKHAAKLSVELKDRGMARVLASRKPPAAEEASTEEKLSGEMVAPPRPVYCGHPRT